MKPYTAHAVLLSCLLIKFYGFLEILWIVHLEALPLWIAPMRAHPARRLWRVGPTILEDKLTTIGSIHWHIETEGPAYFLPLHIRGLEAFYFIGTHTEPGNALLYAFRAQIAAHYIGLPFLAAKGLQLTGCRISGN